MITKRRSFSPNVVESDAFYELPISAQVLYFHICMNARDKGICNGVYTLAKVLNCSKNDVLILCRKGYIKPINSYEFCEWEIVHWYENNGIGETAKKRNNYTYRQWRKAILERDKKCIVCGSEKNLQAHHIKSFAQHPSLRFDLDNGITMCIDCHRMHHRKEKENGRC